MKPSSRKKQRKSRVINKYHKGALKVSCFARLLLTPTSLTSKIRDGKVFSHNGHGVHEGLGYKIGHYRKSFNRGNHAISNHIEIMAKNNLNFKDVYKLSGKEYKEIFC